MEGSGRDPALFMSQTNNQPCAQGVARRMCLINNEGLSSGPVVKSLPAKAEATGLIPGPGRSHVPRNKLSLCTTTSEASEP